MTGVDRPLRLGEILAETIRLYGERIWGALGIGLFLGGVFLLARILHPAFSVLLVALALTAAYAVAARLASGDHAREAWAQLAVRVPVLLVLTVVVSLPVALALSDALLLLLAVMWLALTGFSIPVAMLERDPDAKGWLGRLAYALQRSVTLARTEYLHAVGVAAALVLIYWLVGPFLAALLVSFGENGPVAAFTLAQVVLAPFFFIGLAVLYFDQRARALSSRGRP